jgi:hypothetical protein
MNHSAPFDVPSNSNGAFDYLQSSAISQTLSTNLSNLTDHIQSLLNVVDTVHLFSQEQLLIQQDITDDFLALLTTIQNYQRAILPLVQPVNGEPIVVGAEAWVGRLREHSGFLSSLNKRKKAIRHVKAELEKFEPKKGGVRQDLRFGAERLNALVKELG